MILTLKLIPFLFIWVNRLNKKAFMYIISSVNEEIISTEEVQDIDDKASQEESVLPIEDRELFDRMMESGVFRGRSKSKTNPLMKKYIVSTRSGYEIIDLQKTIESLKKAAEAMQRVIRERKTILMVGTGPAAKSIVKETAKRLDIQYVTERWLGGTLTNFDTISKRIKHFKKLRDDKEAGKLDRYTKKEQLDKTKELAKLRKFFEGIEGLNQLPAMVFLADLSGGKYAAKEAKIKGIPVVAILNTDADISLVDYPIPANDMGIDSIRLIMEYIEKAIVEARATVPLQAEIESVGQEMSERGNDKPIENKKESLREGGERKGESSKVSANESPEITKADVKAEEIKKTED